ncbi:MAG: VWA domain-containing protein [Lachnospiraceae bacterium]|nr:VWA domain-containing protein [Lachnospiraceae bacterium]
MELIFIIDTSGSMYSNRIAAVNTALMECISMIRRNIERSGTQIRVGYMTFDSKPTSLCYIGDVMNDAFPVFSVKSENGFYELTRFEAVYDGIIGLSGKSHTENTGLILITDGKAIDSMTYQEKLEKAKALDLFRKAYRFVACVERDENLWNREDLDEFADFRADRIIELSELATRIDQICRELTDDRGHEAPVTDINRNSVFD